VIAHRGASGYAPEHSELAYKLAIEQGADAIEPDIVISSDGVLVVRHENELSGSTDVASRLEFASRYRTALVAGEAITGWFAEDFTWPELQGLEAVEPHPAVRAESAAVRGQRILRLADVLVLAAAAPRKVTIVIELKTPTHYDGLGYELESLVLAELTRAGWDKQDERLVFESFEVSILRRLREKRIGRAHYYLIDETGTAPDQVALLGPKALTYAEQRREESLRFLGKSVDGISIPVTLFETEEGAELVRLCHDLGLKIFCWTLRAENKFLPRQWRDGLDPKQRGNWEGYFESIMATGVDGVFTDQPDLAGQVKLAVADQP
jgi:glycerophosphoryl diester phosphodiesterase